MMAKLTLATIADQIQGDPTVASSNPGKALNDILQNELKNLEVA